MWKKLNALAAEIHKLELTLDEMRRTTSADRVDTTTRLGFALVGIDEMRSETTKRMDVLENKLAELRSQMLQGRTELGEAIDRVGTAAGLLEGRLAAVEASLERSELVQGDIANLGNLTARQIEVLNHAMTPEGYLSQTGLWFNPPEAIRFSADGPRIVEVNERCVELPFVLGAVGRLDRGSRLLDVGCSESHLALFLASSGFRVTGVDPRGYPLDHPGLTIIPSTLDQWAAGDQQFDAVVFLSSVEHFGLGAYGEERSEGRPDLAALEKASQVLRPGGTLIITVPYGVAAVTPLMRVYDQDGLQELLARWDIQSVGYAERLSASAWAACDEPPSIAQPGQGVALVVATLGRRADEGSKE